MAKIKLSSKITIPASVKDAQKAYKKAANGLWSKAYFESVKKRFADTKKDFKVHKAIGVLFTLLGVRIPSDYLKSRRALRGKLDTIGYALSAEVARDPKLRKIVSDVSKQYPYLSVNKQGEIFVSSFSGSIIDKSTVMGMIFSSENLIPSLAEKRKANQAFRQKLDLRLLLKLGSPRFEATKMTSRKAGARLPGAKTVTAASLGDKEIHIFYKNPAGAAVPSVERVILSEEVASKKIATSSTAANKVVLLRLKSGELIRLDLDAKKAESIFKSFKLVA